MIRVTTKNRKKAKVSFAPPFQVLHETEVAVRKLSEKTEEVNKLSGTSLVIQNTNSTLLARNSGLKVENAQLEKSIEKKRAELVSLNSLIGTRTATLSSLNELLVKVSVKHAEIHGETKSQQEQIDRLLSQYKESQVIYNELVKKIGKSQSEKKAEILGVAKARKEAMKIALESKTKRSEYENFKTQQSEALKRMRFYAGRINRFYKERQMKEPIEVPS